MSKEAMKLALEALQTLHDENMDYLTRNKLGGENNQCMVFAREAITALREALAKPDFWEGYVPEPDSTCSNTLRIQGKAYPRTCKKCGLGPCVGLAQQALDKKAENARELGLDYEPAQQEPVAYLCENAVGHKYFRWKKPSSTYKPIALYTSPPAQRTWVGLTDEEIEKLITDAGFTRSDLLMMGACIDQIARLVEAKLKEKNNG
ncbi:hypothetical protein [Limnohabitans sp.]|uniref:hypothetical protein n=1 Tax=Limnohabitans sp. TaxID=1907725 RepID=UPI00333EEEB6